MRDLPDGVGEDALRAALRAWDIDADALTYAPVGFGDYHWIAAAGARRWFVTVAELRHKDDLGGAMEAAADLAARGLEFVVAPLRPALVALGERHAVSVFPYVDAESGHFGEATTSRERGLILDLLCRLHQATPPPSTPIGKPELPARAVLDEALADLAHPWDGGPYAEPARRLLADKAPGLRERLEEFDARLAALDRSALVVTHGEPHPGNVLRLGERRLLVDWDTVAVAVPERDLWLVLRGADDVARYVAAGGRAPDPSALEFYRLRWALNDAALFVEVLRAPHRSSPDIDHTWVSFEGTVTGLCRA